MNLYILFIASFLGASVALASKPAEKIKISQPSDEMAKACNQQIKSNQLKDIQICHQITETIFKNVDIPKADRLLRDLHGELVKKNRQTDARELQAQSILIFQNLKLNTWKCKGLVADLKNQNAKNIEEAAFRCSLKSQHDFLLQTGTLAQLAIPLIYGKSPSAPALKTKVQL